VKDQQLEGVFCQKLHEFKVALGSSKRPRTFVKKNTNLPEHDTCWGGGKRVARVAASRGEEPARVGNDHGALFKLGVEGKKWGAETNMCQL